MCEPDASRFLRRTLRSPHQEHALLPPIDHLGQVPPIRSGLFENFHQTASVDHLGHREDVGRVLPFTVGHADGGNRARWCGAIPRRGLVRLVRLVRLLFELGRHFKTILGRTVPRDLRICDNCTFAARFLLLRSAPAWRRSYSLSTRRFVVSVELTATSRAKFSAAFR